MADPWAFQGLNLEELPLRLAIKGTEDGTGKKCPVCQNLDGTGKRYNYIDRNASFVTTNYHDLMRSGDLGCTFCAWVAYTIASQAYYELAVPNTEVEVCFGLGRSVQIHELNSRKPEEHSIILEMFTPDGYSPLWQGLGHGRNRCPNPGSAKSMDTIRAWVEKCTREHDRCASATPSLPRRVIDIGPEGSSLTPRLYESNSEHENYIALSHCWGTEPGLRALRHNMFFLSLGLPTRSLPKTFQDAIVVTRALVIRYLWIDSLCIVQDDPVDWQIESSNMCDIYANSFLTIVAAGSVGDTHGFLGPYVSAPTILDTAPQQRDVLRTRIVIRRYGHSGPPEPLFNRAWTYQERFLSRRMILYKQHEIEWQCQLGRNCECRQWLEDRPWRNDGIHEIIEKDRKLHFEHVKICSGSIEEAHDTWKRGIVPKYSRLSLTKPIDRLPALSGIAKLIHTRYPANKYLAGLWAMDFPQALFWQPAGRELAQVASPYRAPSWCWPSIEAPIVFRFVGYYHKRHRLIEILTTDCIPSRPDPHGQVKAGTLTAKAPFLRVKAMITAPEEDNIEQFEFPYSYMFQREEDPVVQARGGLRHRNEQFLPDSPLHATRSFISQDPEKATWTLKRWDDAPTCIPECVQDASVWIMFVMSQERELEDEQSNFIYSCLVLGDPIQRPDVMSFQRLGYWGFSSESGAARWLEYAELTTFVLV